MHANAYIHAKLCETHTNSHAHIPTHTGARTFDRDTFPTREQQLTNYDTRARTHTHTRTRTHTQDHDTFLKREAMLRMAAEKEVELKSNEVEALHLELLQVRQKSP